MKIYQPVISGSLTVTGSSTFIGSVTLISGSLSGTSSLASTASSADTFLVRNDLTASSAVVTGTLTAQTLVVQTITSSIDYVTGSTRFGSLLTNTHTFTGSMYVTGSTVSFAGNVGIATIPSAWSGFNAQQVGNAAIWSTSVNNTHISSNTYYDGTNRIYISTGTATEYASQNGAHWWGIAASGTGGTTQTMTEYMRLTTTGLGIGTASPGYTLDVSGSGRFTGNITATNMFVNTTDNSSGAKLQVFGSINFKGNSGYNGWIISQTGGNSSAAFNLSYGSGGAQNVITAQYDTGMVSINGLAASTNYKFGVTGSAYVNGANGKGIFITDQASYASVVGLNSAISAYNNLELRASGIDGQLYLTTGGNVLIGTTSDNSIAALQINGGAYASLGLKYTYSLGTISQNTTITQAIPNNGGGFYLISNGGNNSALFMITRSGGSQGCQLVFSTNGNADVVCGTTSEPAGGNYLRLWIGSVGILSIKNVNAYTGPYYLTAISTF